jgi:NADH dehydrogenase
MRIVLLGATGFVGHHLLPRLSAAGHACTVLTRHPDACRELRLVPGVRLIQADVHLLDVLLKNFADADAAINLVGILNEKGRNGRGFHRVHVELTEKVIAACHKAGISRLLQVSALNAGKGNSHYLASKGLAEKRLKAASDLDVTILQPSVIFGRGDKFFNRFASLLNWMPVMPLACADSRLQPVYAGDVANAIVRSLPDPATHGKSYELAGPGCYSLRQLVEMTARFRGQRRLVAGLPDVLSRLQAGVMNWIPGKPFSTDNYRSLQIDNISNNNGLPGLGISPVSVEACLPAYLSGSLQQQRLGHFRKRVGR